MSGVAYYGDFSEDATVYMPFNTFSSDDPSASVTITNLADGDIKVHKDGSTTQIVTDGATIAVDFDSITGNHLATIDTSAHADYSTGSDYIVRIEGTTVDGATINAWIGSFSIENRHGSTTANTVLTDTEAIISDTEAILTDAEAILVDTGTTLDTVVDAILVDTEAAATSLGTIITDTEAILTDTGTTLLADTEAIRTDTETTLLTDTEAILADTEAGITERATLLSDTEAILTDTGTTLLADTEAIRSDTETTLLTDTEAILADTEAISTSAILTDTEAILADTEASGVSAAEVADAVWEEAITDHSGTSGSTAEALDGASVSGLLSTQLTESYPAAGTAPTVEQALMMNLQRATEFSVSGTTITVKRLDGSTTAFTLSMNDGTNPTSSSREA